jgi:hypothetical protein
MRRRAPPSAASSKAPFREAVGGATACTTINCRKSEARVSLAYDDLALSPCRDRGLPMLGAANVQESAQKKTSSLFPRNPLKSLDSDERIQGNPRESNPQFAWINASKRPFQEKPNGLSGPPRDAPSQKSSTESLRTQSPHKSRALGPLRNKRSPIAFCGYLPVAPIPRRGQMRQGVSDARHLGAS